MLSQLNVARTSCVCTTATSSTEADNEAESRSILQEANRGFWLVRAKCSSIDAVSEEAQWKIISVFNGPEILVGKTFSIIHSRENFGGHPLNFFPKPNDDAVWTVRLYDDDPWAVKTKEDKPSPVLGASIVSREGSRFAYGIDFPVAQSYNAPLETAPPIYSNFDEALVLAQLIQRVAQTTDNTQLQLLKEYTRIQHPELSAWSILTLAESGVRDVSPFLFNLVNDIKVPQKGKVALDQALLSLDDVGGTRGARTPERLNFWERLVTSPASKSEANSIVHRVTIIARIENSNREKAAQEGTFYNPTISSVQLFHWLRSAASNADWDVEPRTGAVRGVSGLVDNKLITRSEAWDYWLSLLKQHPDFAMPTALTDKGFSPQMAERALIELSNLRPFTPDEMIVLRPLQQQAKSTLVKRLLDSIVEAKR